MVTLRELRRGAAPELDFFDLVQTSTASATGGDIIVAEYADSDLPPRTFGSTYALICAGAMSGQQRRIQDSGYGNTNGRLVFSRPLASAVEQHVECEILGIVPAIRQLGEPGWREHANACLRDVWVERRLLIPAIAGQTSYDVTTPYPWLTDRRQITDPLAHASTLTDYALPGANLRGVRNDGGTVWVELWTGYQDGQSFELPARAPGHTWIKHDGVWGQTTVGLVDDDDETPAPFDLLRLMMLERATRHLMLQAPATEAAVWRGQHATFAAAAGIAKQRYLKPGPTSLRLVPASGASVWPKGLFG